MVCSGDMVSLSVLHMHICLFTYFSTVPNFKTKKYNEFFFTKKMPICTTVQTIYTSLNSESIFTIIIIIIIVVIIVVVVDVVVVIVVALVVVVDDSIFVSF